MTCKDCKVHPRSHKGEAYVQLCPLHASAGELLEALEAIKARIDGEWEHPALVEHGPLFIRLDGDVLRMVREVINAAKEKPHG